MTSNFNEIVYEVLIQQSKPVEIFDLVDMVLVVKPLKAHPNVLAQTVYALALREDSNVVVAEYPYFAIRNHTEKPALTRGTISAAYKSIQSKRGSVELRDIVQHAIQQGFLDSSAKVPEYWVYLKLRRRKDVGSSLKSVRNW